MSTDQFGKFSRFARKKDEAAVEDTRPIVMVVDDDFSIRNALSFTLKEKYRVVTCENGDQGITKMNEDVHVVILDIKMPGKDGLQVYTEIKGSHPNVPIIFYSAFQDIMESIQLRRQYKPFGYFDKNGDTEEFFNKIGEAVLHFERFSKLREATDRLKSKRDKQ